MSKRAAIYCRVSTEGQEGNSSLAAQEQSCRDYAAKQGYEVVGEISEVAPNVNLLARAGLEQALDLIASGTADVLIVHATDRLSRHQIDLAVLMNRVEQHGGAVVSVTEPFGYLGDRIVNQIQLALAFQNEGPRYAVELLRRGQRLGLTVDDLLDYLGEQK
ncbi:MAG: recombinase family protein [Thermomicrobiales bacterium]